MSTTTRDDEADRDLKRDVDESSSSSNVIESADDGESDMDGTAVPEEADFARGRPGDGSRLDSGFNGDETRTDDEESFVVVMGGFDDVDSIACLRVEELPVLRAALSL